MESITCLSAPNGTVESESDQQKQDQPVASRTRRLSSASSHRVTLTSDESRRKDKVALSQASKEPSIKQIAGMLLKDSSERSEDEVQMMGTFTHLIPAAESYLKSKQEKKLLKQRLMEVEESLESIETKTDILANLIKTSKHVVIYTGAGISTSASIPDYRGPNGLWTQIKKTGTFSITKLLDLSNAEPTYTHMAIRELCRRRVIKHVVSQNCDGLHLRSGIAQNYLSEIHGNMYIEVCPTCERQYYREADVTQQTSRFRHKTGRVCHTCLEPNNNLVDTIVLYGERSRTKRPMNWERASKAATDADLIICMGSSLKTLRRYGCLWPKISSSTSAKKSKSDTKLVIINLQHTPKDKNAILKINGKCDLVMQQLMKRLKIGVSAYHWSSDPLLNLAVPFKAEERLQLKRNLIFDSKRHSSNAISTSPMLDESSMSPSSSSSTKRSIDDENRDSPSLFVSELTDDPDKKRLRMRIRAVNVGAAGSSGSPEINDTKLTFTTTTNNASGTVDNSGTDGDGQAVIKENKTIKQELEDYNSENLSTQPSDVKLNQQPQQYEFAPPGWLGKSLGYQKSSSYRRKRHGNKDRKRAAPVVPQVVQL